MFLISSPKSPAGRIILGVPGWTLVLLYLMALQHRKREGEGKGERMGGLCES